MICQFHGQTYFENCSKYCSIFLFFLLKIHFLLKKRSKGEQKCWALKLKGQNKLVNILYGFSKKCIAFGSFYWMFWPKKNFLSKNGRTPKLWEFWMKLGHDPMDEKPCPAAYIVDLIEIFNILCRFVYFQCFWTCLTRIYCLD